MDAIPVEADEAAPAALPKTGSQVPLIGILGVLALLFGLSLRRSESSDSARLPPVVRWASLAHAEPWRGTAEY